jgi:cobaltochelatase CobT
MGDASSNHTGKALRMALPTNKKDSPVEPFKRVLGLAVRAIAGDNEIQVNYGPGKPELDGAKVSLPEPSRIPTAKEIAVIRGRARSENASQTRA